LEDFDFPEYKEARLAYPRIYHKTDKLGRPLYIERTGKIHLADLNKACSNEKMLKNHVYEYEKLVRYRMAACSIKSGRHHEQSVTILDLDGVALSTFSSVYSIVSQISAIAQDHYPEMYLMVNKAGKDVYNQCPNVVYGSMDSCQKDAGRSNC
jgi:hypothetical protein